RAGLRFVWGPPGTGKTGTLAATVHHLVDHGQRVLMLAHANAAVDVAMTRIATRMDGHNALLTGRVLRAGTPQSAEARSTPWINPDEVLRRRVPALIGEYEDLLAQRAALARTIRQAATNPADAADALDAVRARLAVVETRVKEARNELLVDAVV